MTEIEGLIERLEKAAGPDRELDRDLTERFYPTVATPDTRAHGDPAWRHPDFGLVRCEYYTASLDAALALVERVRPGWKWERQWEPGGEFIRLLAPDYHRWTFKGALNRAATGWQSCEPGDAIALCLALLRTLETDNDA